MKKKQQEHVKNNKESNETHWNCMMHGALNLISGKFVSNGGKQGETVGE